MAARRAAETGSLGPTATLALGLAAAVVVVLGLLQTVIAGQFPGATWFIVRVAIMTPLVLAWWAMAGTDRIAAATGGVMIGFLLITYGHYLSPAGFPNPSLRLLSADPDGTIYNVEAVQPLVADPRGRYTTWAGVGFDVWHHGRSGIGSNALPPMNSPVAVFAFGSVSVDGELIATGVPVHVGTSSGPDVRLELHVGDVEAPVPGLPEGHLRVVWNDYSGGNTRGLTNARYALGGGVLLVLLGFALTLVRRSIAPEQNSRL